MMRIGLGYDIHRLKPGRPLMLGGLEIPHSAGLEGHSDGDALLHALTDAILGAIGEPDIGELFPSEDSRHRDADSRIFLAEALKRLQAAGKQLVNADAVIIAQKPKMAPHKTAIIQSVAQLLQVDPMQINIKAKTTEGFPPGEEGIAVHAVVLVQ